MSKRLIAGVIAGLFVFGAVFGMAASLNLTPDGLGADDEVIAACDSNGVTTSYTTAFQNGQYEVTGVTVNGIDDDCGALTVKVQLSGASGAISGASGSGTVSTSAGVVDARQVSITLGTAASAEAATGIQVVIG